MDRVVIVNMIIINIVDYSSVDPSVYSLYIRVAEPGLLTGSGSNPEVLQDPSP